jgi:AcrR family transcriptional regulator
VGDGEPDELQLPRVLAAALARFAEHGYHGTSIRDLAQAAGLSVPGLYHHYRSKQELLAALLTAVMEDLVRGSRSVAEAAGADPGRRFDALVDHLLRYHMVHRREAFVASSELRSLEPEHRAAIVALRDEQQGMLLEAIERGRATGLFDTDAPADAARAVATLCVGVASWYREDGLLSQDRLAERYLGFARALAGATDRAAR